MNYIYHLRVKDDRYQKGYLDLMFAALGDRLLDILQAVVHANHGTPKTISSFVFLVPFSWVQFLATTAQ